MSTRADHQYRQQHHQLRRALRDDTINLTSSINYTLSSLPVRPPAPMARAPPSTTTPSPAAVQRLALRATITTPTTTAPAAHRYHQRHWTEPTLDGFGRTVKTKPATPAAPNPPSIRLRFLRLQSLGKMVKTSMPYRRTAQSIGSSIRTTAWAARSRHRTGCASTSYYSYVGNTPK